MLLTKIGLYNNIIHLLCGTLESQWDRVGQIRSVSFPFWAMKKLNKMKAGQVQDVEG